MDFLANTIQGNLQKDHKKISFNSRFAGQKGVTLCIQNAERRKKLPPRIFYPTKMSFRIEGEIEFSREEKAKGIHHP